MGRYRELFRSKVEDLIAAGMNRQDAVASVCKNDPKLQQNVIAEANPETTKFGMPVHGSTTRARVIPNVGTTEGMSSSDQLTMIARTIQREEQCSLSVAIKRARDRRPDLVRKQAQRTNGLQRGSSRGSRRIVLPR